MIAIARVSGRVDARSPRVERKRNSNIMRLSEFLRHQRRVVACACAPSSREGVRAPARGPRAGRKLRRARPPRDAIHDVQVPRRCSAERLPSFGRPVVADAPKNASAGA